MKEAFKTFPEITHASASIGAPGALPGMVVPVQVEGAGMAEGLPVRIVSVDEDFIPTLGIRLLEGRNFSADRATDGTQACIINEAAVRQLGLTSPVNQSLSLGREKLPVIGVVRDFHFESFHNNIAPLIFRMIPDQYRILVLRVSSGDLKSVLPLIEGQWQQFAPGYFFSYSLLEDDLAGLYQKEYDLQSLFLTFSAVAMMIACLGVLGLSAFLTGQRSKEIALRRVVGASMRHIIALIAGDFLLLVGLSTAIASPVAYYFMQRWLQDFAYRVQIDLLSFVWAGLITAALTLITVGSQVIKVARANPVETLRYQH
jgi:putative ABC transport system permease protein